MQTLSLDDQLIEEVGEVVYDPLSFVTRFFPWGKGPLDGYSGPKQWQADSLKSIRDHLSNPATRFTPYQEAIASGHGIGKSAHMGMVVSWGMSCFPDCKVVVTAGTGAQLSTKTVPEISKWFKLLANAHWFDVRATSVRSKVPGHELSWRTDFETWSEHNTEAFAGLHNAKKLIILIYDESSAIAPKVWEVSEGALTDEGTVILWLAYGNPTQNTGRFRECFGKFKHRWRTRQIDSRTVEGTNKEQIEKWIADYGEDSDFVRVRVRGEFPRAGSSQFIASDIVAAARNYHASGYESLPRVLSVDVARFGDDQTIIGLRQGRHFEVLGKYRGKDIVWTAEETIRRIDEQKPDATIIDGDGLGAGVVDTLKHRGYSQRLYEFHGGAPANDGAAYFNRRAEIWGSLRDWLMAGAQIPDDPELEADLTGPEYGFSPKQQIQLERKEDMKSRGLASPDMGDCLAMSFAVKVMAKPKEPKPVMYTHEMSNSWMGG